MKARITLVTIFSVGVLSFTSCNKFVQVGPPQTEVVASEVFSNDGLATAALLNIYGKMMNGSTATFTSAKATLLCGQSADELVSYASTANATYYTNSLISTTDDFWTPAYGFIYQANAVIEGLSKYSGVTPALKQQLTGEALFIRAFCHFYLVNLFGDVPYITTTDYNTNNLAVRMPSAQVYQKIIADLLQAQSMLGNNFLSATNVPGVERVRPNKAAVTALLARVYLYNKDWTNAEIQASSILSNSATYSLVNDLTKVFLKNSSEAIWQLQPSTTTLYTNTYEAPQLVVTATPNGFSGATVSLTDQIWNAFETGDKRQQNWVGTYTDAITKKVYHYAYKYKVIATGSAVPVSEYYMVLRVAEQVLIRAEARAQLNKLTDAISDLNMLRSRAGLNPLPNTLTQAQVLAAVAQERKVELFVEWGHRWMDLKRTGQADAVVGPLKGPNWQTTDQLYPIPQTQLQLDPNMTGSQNPGYN